MYLKRVDVEGYRAAASDPLTCEFTGRFNLLLGANGAGKTTINESILHAHRHKFPRPGAVDATALGPPPRGVSVEYAFDEDAATEGALGNALKQSGFAAPGWSRPLERSLGKVRAGSVVNATEGHDNIRLVYLPALRNPVDELSRRDAQVLLELLRAEQLRRTGPGALNQLRNLAESMLSSITSHQLIVDVQGRIAENLSTISSGVSEHFPFVGTQTVDDAYLARVLELLLATTPSPEAGRRLEASSLGYVNLLHIAVTLAGIPDPAEETQASGDVSGDDLSGPSTGPEQSGEADSAAEGARERLHSASAAAEADQDSFFPDLFHATVLIEEPEAHLHPQLQHGLVRYLRRVAEVRKDLQVLVTTHSSEIVAACDPAELVVIRRDMDRRTVARTLKALPLESNVREFLFEQTRLHMDAERSASFFAEQLLVVEGVTEAALLRVVGRAWAVNHPTRLAFIEALSIVFVGHKVGQWPIRLVGTPGFELVTRVAALADTDRRGDPLPDAKPPDWHKKLDAESARFFWSRPTLEPSLLPGNEAFFRRALERLKQNVPDPMNAGEIDGLFKSNPSLKGRFALVLASEMSADLSNVRVPKHVAAAYAWLMQEPPPADGDKSAGTDESGLQTT
ncbi:MULTISPECIES: ATP-dependent nuclease [unclassified Mycobacterium]|uniref:ATP-dependent nuclease n=1 Tax=unclassified Mycobacterium TaxID=2642494 RepID=UPI0029C94700|nr:MULTISPECIES: AAA family ATPase [unclassified Mycobacterium]